MDKQTLHAEVREKRGKGQARQLRSRGLIPAVFYGRETETTLLAISPKDLRRVLGTEHGRNAVVSLAMGDQNALAMVKDVQMHPVTNEPLHADLYRVHEGKPVDVLVPFSTTGRAAGVVKGGELHVIFRALPVRANPEVIPSKITVDVTALELGEAIAVKDLALPEGVQILLPEARSVVSVQMEKKKGTDDAQPGEAAPGAAAATPAAS